MNGKRKRYKIAFLGTDGSGKTTIINMIIPMLKEGFHRSVYYEHMRPNYLPSLARLFGNKEGFDKPVANPHGKKISGLPASLFRFVYYMIDYTLGYWVKVFPQKASHSSVWLFDRYYYDYQIDPHRSRINLPNWLLRLGQFIIPEPDLIICLGADPLIIHARKAELPLSEIQRQVSSLAEFCKTHKRAIWIDTGSSLNLSVKETMKAITSVMENENLNRLNKNENLRYYYFNPFSKQYYFPVGFEKYYIFNSFYQPYTRFGQLIWFCWMTLHALPWLFSEKVTEKTLPIARIKKHAPVSAIMAFNRGTPGMGQKITVLGIVPYSGEEFFIKYAESPIACKNVCNEGSILSQIAHLDFVPQLQLSVSEVEYSLIRTNVLKGERVVKQSIDKYLVAILLQLAKQHVIVGIKHDTELKSCFANGDCCPWNMMMDNGRLNLFDWEMAGNYPLGYDLFTYIFQTSFLLFPHKKMEQLIEHNQTMILDYFNFFNIGHWQPYLRAFAEIKCELEIKEQDQNQILKAPYDALKSYAEKI